MDERAAPEEIDERDDHVGAGARRFVRHHGAAVAGLLGALVIVVAAGPVIADRVGDELRHESSAAPLDAAPASIDLPAAGPTPPTVPATSPTSTRPSDTSATSSTVSPPTLPPSTGTEPVPMTAPAAVTRIQTVPAIRDVIFDIGGRQVATDAAGSVAIGPADAGATVRVIGTVADPPVQTVAFGLWGDGSVDAERSLATLDGPVAEVGLVVRSRVLLAATTPVAAGATASFTSDVGVVEVPFGEPTWVPATLAVRSATGLVPVDVGYALAALSDGSTSVPQAFRPTPEATWRITI